MWVARNGSVEAVIGGRIYEIRCNMTYSKYPLDVQMCDFEIRAKFLYMNDYTPVCLLRDMSIICIPNFLVLHNQGFQTEL